MVLVPLLLVLGGGITCDQQLDRYQVSVGETVMVILNLVNSGDTMLDVNVTPDYSSGMAGPVWSGSMAPGEQRTITYMITAQQPGTYEIASVVDYSDESGSYQLTLMAEPLTVI